jgi:phosphonate transport system substrate-binding protein
LAASAALYVAACNGAVNAPPAAPLQIGLFAADATNPPDQLTRRYQPVTAYLETALSRPVQITVSPDASRILADFEAGRFDLAFNRAIAFPHAQAHAGAVALVVRQEDRQTTTVFVTAGSDPRQALDDFEGSTLEFSLRLGSSYVMGRHFLEERGIVPERFFREVRFSTVADEAIHHVRERSADLGVANSNALRRMLTAGTIKPGDLRIIAETPPHAGQLWFASRLLDATVRNALRDAFMALSPDEPAHTPVLSALAASGFVPALADDYRLLADLMREMQMLEFDASELP